MKKWFIIFGLWNLVAVINTSRGTLYRYIKFGDDDWFPLAYLQFSIYWIWAILTPLIYWLSVRFPIQKTHLVRNIVVLLLAGCIISTIHSFGTYVLEYSIRDLLGQLENTTVLEVVSGIDRLTVPGVLDSVIIYLIVVALIHGYEFYNSLQRQKLINSQLETSLIKTKLHVLKSQLHPHFLFNTLHTVSALIEKNPKIADKVVTSLSDLLRFSFSKITDEKITLKEEILFVKKYLEIQQIRFPDKLTVVYEIPDFLLAAKIPHLLLQPLVENALKHGLEPKHESGKLLIKVFENDTTLQFMIEDNGVGLATNSKYATTGVGISNTKERLQNMYGDNFRFSLENLLTGGVRINIKLPLELTAMRHE